MLRRILALHAALYRAPRALPGGASPFEDLSPDRLDFALSASAARGAAPDWAAADEALAWLEAPGRSVLVIGRAGYPPLLRATAAPPALLFVDGDPTVLASPQIAVVGSRQATPRGQDIALEFARGLATLGVTVTSGLARGIDGAAHRGALAGGGRTVAVLGCAVDRVYPSAHRALAEEIRGAGALISEFPFGTAPLPAHFPRRNRIVSGLTLGTLVIEAALRSGSLSTALHALEQGREVFAVPGSIRSPLSQGCHALIKQGAKLVESLADIVEELPELHALGGLAPCAGEPAAPPPSDARERRLLVACGWDAFTSEDVVQRSGLTVQEVSSMLLKLELAGIIQVQGTGSYLRIR